MPKRMTGIYLIRHKSTGRSYVGQALSIRSRWTQHKKLLTTGKHHSPGLQELWNRDGECSFDFLVLEEAPSGKTELEVQRWLISRERAEYNRLKDSGLLLNATLPAIVPTKKAKEQYTKEKKQQDKENNRKISYERGLRKQELQSILKELHPIDAQYALYRRELNDAQRELDRNTGFFATLFGRASKFDRVGCQSKIASLQKKIAQIEPQVMRLRARAQELRYALKSLYNSYAGVRERRVRRTLARVGIFYTGRTIR